MSYTMTPNAAKDWVNRMAADSYWCNAIERSMDSIVYYSEPVPCIKSDNPIVGIKDYTVFNGIPTRLLHY